MAKIRLRKLPDGFELKNGKLVKSFKSGGSIGDQANYALNTNNQARDVSMSKDEKNVRYSLKSVPREIANIEAEGGETVLTDLNNNGQFGLYDINGPRHNRGGVPMYLPEQSFIYSDTQKMKMSPKELAEFGIKSKKKMTPAQVSKRYNLNKFISALEDVDSDPIRKKSAELMLDKNQKSLSKLAFAQEAKKNFEDGIPLAAYPYLVNKGIDPEQLKQQLENSQQMKYGGGLYKAQSGVEMPDWVKKLRERKARSRSEAMSRQPNQRINDRYGNFDVHNAKPDYTPLPSNESSVRPGIQFRNSLYQPEEILPHFNQKFDNVSNMPKPSSFRVTTTQSNSNPYTVENQIDLINDLDINMKGKPLSRSKIQTPNRNSPIQQNSQIQNQQDIINQQDVNNQQDVRVAKQVAKSDDKPVKISDSQAKQIKRDKSGFGQYIQYNKSKGAWYYYPPKDRSSWTIDKLTEHASLAEEYGIKKFTQGRTPGYNHFYAGFKPTDYEKKLVYEMYGEEGINGKSEIEIRQMAFDLLGIDYSDMDLSDDKAIYNNEKIFNNIYEGFTNYLPDDEFRKQKGNDRMFGLEHYDAIKVNKPDNPYSPEPLPSREPAPQPDIFEPLPIRPFEADNTMVDPGEFWLQDKNNLNAISMRQRKAFYPWEAPVDFANVGYVLEDPTRALANVNEQANIASRSLGAFTGPQALNARLSDVQGKAYEQAANILGQVNARNVGTVNRGLTTQAQFDQTGDAQNRERLRRLYDGTTRTAQRFIKERNEDRDEFTNLMNTAYTNRANTMNLNAITPNYNIDPASGGIIQFAEGFDPRDLANRSNVTSDKEDILDYLKRAKSTLGDSASGDVMKLLIENKYGKTTKPDPITSDELALRGYGKARRGIELRKYASPFYTGKIGL